jgi:peptidyl-prolyl cis-trans isomerase A (cyclophilin A)
MKPLLYAITLLVAFLGGNLQAQITADLAISEGGTSIGTITLELDHVKAPMATANFIGLASGQFAWIDSTTGVVRKKPYYDGIIFHRVIAGFMNQTGSQKGDGSDGPGYTFQDGAEVSNGLNHGIPYVVSMANSGLNTNGSQIFITVEDTSHLDGKHIVFGNATTGSETLIDHINNVTVVNNLPVDEVRIESVTINFNGVSFDIHAQGLPIVEAPEFTVSHDGSLVELNVSQEKGSATRYYYSEDLVNWSYGGELYKEEDATESSVIDVTSAAAGKSKMFFNASKVNYNSAGILWPSSFSDRTLTLEDSLITDQYDTNWVFTFTSENAGTVVNGTESGSFTVQWSSGDRFGMQMYILTDLLYSFDNSTYDIGFVVNLAKYAYSVAEITGAHSGRIYLIKEDGNSRASGPTSGAMTLTR